MQLKAETSFLCSKVQIWRDVKELVYWAASRLCRHDTWEGHGDIEDIIELLQCALQTYTVQRPSQQPSHTWAHTLHHTPLKTTRTMMTKRNKIRKNPRKNNYFQTHIITIIIKMQNYETTLQKTQSHVQRIITIKIIGSAVSLCPVELYNFDIDSHRWKYTISLTSMCIDQYTYTISLI